MELKAVPFASPPSAYDQQAQALLDAHRDADPSAIDLLHRKHPRFLDETVKWRPKFIRDSEIRDAALSLDDAKLAVARWYDFLDWPSLIAHVESCAKDGPTYEFESAVEAVVNGDLGQLAAALRRDASLVHARSSRVCCFDPPVHHATLLHYVSANGVEGYRQKTPANAVDIARALLQAGAEPDSLADMYGSEWTPLNLLVSSSHPAAAGLQVPLLELLLDSGAAIEGRGAEKWGTPLTIALVFGMTEAAGALVKRGARIDLVAAAGLGLVEQVANSLRPASTLERHRALALAAQHAHLETVRVLLDAGEDPSRFNPKRTHEHSTPLHQAVLTGNEAVVRLLVERGARLDVRDRIWQSTPLGWALHGGARAPERMSVCLRSLGAIE
jgi:hypothetical protein